MQRGARGHAARVRRVVLRGGWRSGRGAAKAKAWGPHNVQGSASAAPPRAREQRGRQGARGWAAVGSRDAWRLPTLRPPPAAAPRHLAITRATETRTHLQVQLLAQLPQRLHRAVLVLGVAAGRMTRWTEGEHARRVGGRTARTRGQRSCGAHARAHARPRSAARPRPDNRHPRLRAGRPPIDGTRLSNRCTRDRNRFTSGDSREALAGLHAVGAAGLAIERVHGHKGVALAERLLGVADLVGQACAGGRGRAGGRDGAWWACRVAGHARCRCWAWRVQIRARCLLLVVPALSPRAAPPRKPRSPRRHPAPPRSSPQRAPALLAGLLQAGPPRAPPCRPHKAQSKLRTAALLAGLLGVPVVEAVVVAAMEEGHHALGGLRQGGDGI